VADWEELARLAPDADHNAVHDIAGGQQYHTGQHLYDTIADSPDAASAQLRELGIPGITYKGGSSGERNFVVFDDQLINTVDKRQIPLAPMVGAAGAAGAGAMMAPEANADAQYANQIAMMEENEFQKRAQDFVRARTQKDPAFMEKVRGMAEAALTVGSGIAGGIAGDLSRFSGYLNPMMSVEDTEAGAEEVARWITYEPSPAADPYLEPVLDAAAQYEQDVDRAVQSIDDTQFLS
jgi:hypothetical protein